MRERVLVKGITVDCENPHEVDDAIWAEPAKGGVWLKVSVPDLTEAVPLDSDVEKRAFERPFSRYDGNGGRLMFPKWLLSETSLLPGKPRPAITLSMLLSERGQVKSYQIEKTLLENSWMFSFNEADAALLDPGHSFYSVLSELERISQMLWPQKNSGYSGFITDYFRFEFFESEICYQQRDEESRGSRSQAMIEKLMLAANRTYADHFASQPTPALFRNHVFSERQNFRLERMRQILPDRIKRSGREKTVQRLWQTVARSLDSARCEPVARGHFEFNFSNYTWMTSPLRRYQDLANQRILCADHDSSSRPYTNGRLWEIADHCNHIERLLKKKKKTARARRHQGCR